ncbi:MAG: penicillin acylase family protein [Pseudomonadota bacterium]
MKPFRRLTGSASIVAALLLAACSDSNTLAVPPPAAPPVTAPEPPVAPTFSADITWTEFGIPHVSAEDWSGLGYGTGYAFARENFCVAMREYVVAAGETARYFGDAGSLEIDFVWKLLNADSRIDQMLQEVPERVLNLFTGYAAGFNRYLADTGAEGLPEACRNATWVRNIELRDAMRVAHKLVLLASGDPLAPFIAASRPPEQISPARLGLSPTTQERLAQVDPASVHERMGFPEHDAIGSNAYAVGAESSQTGVGVLLSNPHFPWVGGLRLFMMRQTIPDEIDVMGEGLYGAPIVGLGFNANIAWGHTVSTGNRFSLYELTLNPDNPLQYIYDGEVLDFEPVVVTAERQRSDGVTEAVERRFYLSRFGPTLDLGAVSPLLGGWPNAVGTVLVYRDANLANARVWDQWIAMGAAANVAEVKEATRAMGLPLVNTLATDRSGDAFFGNISVSANLSDAQITGCVRGPVQSLLTAGGFLTLDGSDSFCDWNTDEGAPPGLFAYDSLPKLDTRDYVANSNDSHWIVNPRNLLEGFPLAVGGERLPLNLRPRQTLVMAEQRIAGTDDLGDPGFDIDNIRALMYRADNYTAELTVDAIVSACSAVDDWSNYTANAVAAEAGCTVLQGWDRAHRLDSVGAHVFWELWQRLAPTPGLWAVPFDVADPINTPREIDLSNTEVVEAVRSALAGATDRLLAASIPIDARWGDVQFIEKNGVRYGIHGGDVSMMFSAIVSPLVDGEGYSAIETGNSYIQAVTWDETDCPIAYGALTYSQSTNPDSLHFADATQRYSESGWIDMPYCASAVEAAEIERLSISE